MIARLFDEPSKEVVSAFLKAILQNNVEEVAKYESLYLRQFNLDFFQKKNSKNSNYSLASLPLTMLFPLHVATLNDSLEAYIYISKKTKMTSTTPDSNNFTAIHYACLYDSYEIVSYCFELAKTNQKMKKEIEELFENNYRTNNQSSVLCLLACKGNSLRILELLVENGYKIVPRLNIICEDIAFRMRNTQILKYLLKRCDITKPDIFILYHAIQTRSLNVIPLIINELDCNLNEYDENTFLTPLFCACFSYSHDDKTKEFSFKDVIKLLLGKMTEIDIPLIINYKAAAHWMCFTGDIEIIKMFLQHNIDINRLDQNGKSCISYIPNLPEQDTLAILNLLYEYGIDLNKPDFNPITTFLKIYNISFPILKWFLGHGSDPDKSLDIRNNDITVRQYIIDRHSFMNEQSEGFEQLINIFNL